jgi:hypothetical protein
MLVLQQEMADRSGMSQIPQIKTGRTRGSPLQPLQTQGAESETSGAANSARVRWNASALSTFDPTTLQSDADFHWLADTGATSHMTPHRAWMRNYTPLN